MDPFDLPPAGAPVSVDAPQPSPDSVPDRPRRGRAALVAILALGLVGGGVAGVSQLASADRADPAATGRDDPLDDTIAPVDEGSDEASDEGSDDESDRGSNDGGTTHGDPETTDDPETTNDGQIVIDTGDGDPVVIDLGDLDLGDLDIGRIGELTECVGLPASDADGRVGELTRDDWNSCEFRLVLEELLGDLPFDLDALEDLDGDWPTESGDVGDLGGFGIDGGSVTVVGPDGVSVVDLGENGSVTVTADDGEISVSTDGDATVSELDDLLREFGSIFERGSALFGDELHDDQPLGN